MNYAQSSDKELNIKLLELIHGDVVNYWCLSDDEAFIYDCGPIGEDFHKIELKDYCNDWNATMPLAVQYGVTPILDDGYGFATNDPYEVYEPHGKNQSDGFFNVSMDEETPLRAIVICLIKILEAKSGN